MQDISEILKFQMTKNHCSSLCAFLNVTEEKKDVYILQPKPTKEIGRGLRNQSDIKNHG